MVEAIDAGGMAVGEFDLDRISPYRRGGSRGYFWFEHGKDGRAGRLGFDLGMPFVRFFACGTGAMFTKVGKVVVTDMRV